MGQACSVASGCLVIMAFRRCPIFVVFMQKTAYEVLRNLVGTEMCIRD